MRSGGSGLGPQVPVWCMSRLGGGLVRGWIGVGKCVVYGHGWGGIPEGLALPWGHPMYICAAGV